MSTGIPSLRTTDIGGSCTELHSLKLMTANYRSALQKPRGRLCDGRGRFQAAGDNGEGTEALDHAMYALHALRSNYQNLGAP
jgi:hypothetical protein